MQVFDHVLERRQQTADLVLRVDLQPMRQIALRHGLSQVHGMVNRARDGAGDEGPRGNGQQRGKNGQHDHLDLGVGALGGSLAHIVLHLAGLVVDHLVDQHVVPVLQARHVTLVQGTRLLHVVGIDQREELADAGTVG